MGTVIADDATTYTTLTAWEATVGTVGGPGGTCSCAGTFDEVGVILDYTNNLLEDPSAKFIYSITGGNFVPTTTSAFGVISIVTSTKIWDMVIDGKTAREEEEWVNTGVDITLTGDETAHLYRVRVSGLGELGGNDSIGIKCDDQASKDRTVQLNHCYVTDIRHSGGNDAYGISFAHGNRNLINRDNEPSLQANFCTADSITSQNDVSATTNESFGFKITDASGTTVESCVSHKITGGNGYFGGTASVLCYGGSTTDNNIWRATAGAERALVGGNQSSDRTGRYPGVRKDINVFTGAPGRPDPAVEFKSENEIHDLKIVRSPGILTSQTERVSINGVYNPDSIGAFATYRVIYVGSNQTSTDTYTTITSAVLGGLGNPVINGGYNTGTGGVPYLLGLSGFPHSGSTWGVFYLTGGEFSEQISAGLLTSSNGLVSTAHWAGNVFTGGGPDGRAVFRPGHEGYGANFIDLTGVGQPTEVIVQHIEVHMENNRWGHGIMVNSVVDGTIGHVHDCIVSGSGYLSGSTITESVEVGIAADTVTTCLVYGKIKDGINAATSAYNNTVVLDNMSLTGKGISGGSIKNNLVLTSGTNFANRYTGAALGIDSGGGNGNISDSRTQVNNYFTDAANDDYTLKLNSHALDSGIVPTYGSDYASTRWLPIWPYSSMYVSGAVPYWIDYSHWFIDGGGEGYGGPAVAPMTYSRNRFHPDVAVSGFDTGWDERAEQRVDAHGSPFIAFMDF